MVEEGQAHRPHRPRAHRVGREQAALAAEALAESAARDPLVICSPRQRALATAELAGLRVDEVSPLLAEWDYGGYEGADDPRDPPARPGLAGVDLRLPGRRERGRRHRASGPRCRDGADQMASRDVVFVGHGHFSRAVLARWLQLPLPEGIRFSMVGRLDRRLRFRARGTPARRAGR